MNMMITDNKTQARRYYTYELATETPVEGQWRYIGWRSCYSLPENDPYMGSSAYVDAAIEDGVVFSKRIIAEHSTWEAALEHEIELHAEFNVKDNPEFFNRANQTSTGFANACGPMSEEDCAKMSEAAHKRYKDPEERAKTSEAVRKGMAKPEVRVKRSEAQRKQWKDPEYAAKQSEAARKKWSDPEYAETQSEAQRKRFEDPKARAKRSELSRKQYEDPKARAKASEAAYKRFEDPEARAKQAKAKRKWNTDDTPTAGISAVVTKTKGTLYRPYLKHNGRSIYPAGRKSFETLTEAQQARRDLERKYWGVNPDA